MCLRPSITIKKSIFRKNKKVLTWDCENFEKVINQFEENVAKLADCSIFFKRTNKKKCIDFYIIKHYSYLTFGELVTELTIEEKNKLKIIRKDAKEYVSIEKLEKRIEETEQL